MDDLEERLNSHARAFEGIMSLIPAKHYYGEDTSDQWQRKKQSKEERRAAKKAKLKPDARRSALDVMEENERKRKREMEGEGESEIDAPGKEKPKEGMKIRKPKKKKLNDGRSALPDGASANNTSNAESAEVKEAKAKKRKEKSQRKKEENAKPQQESHAEQPHAEEPQNEESPRQDQSVDEPPVTQEAERQELVAHSAIASQTPAPNTTEDIQVSQPAVENMAASPSSATSTPHESPASATSVDQPTSSISSIVPPSQSGEEKKSKKAFTIPNIDPEILKARLQARIDALRAARKADGLDGKPARNRQELIEARRRKELQRREQKKESKANSKELERLAAEAELARLRGSGSPPSLDLFSPPREQPDTNFSFGRVTFDDGQKLDSSLSTFHGIRKVKGPQDPRTALEAVQRKQARINGLDEQKKANVEEKDLWLNAKKRAHSEKVKDDSSLLKKTLKRKEKGKEKSEKEWHDRAEGVKKGQEVRQKKREDNLRKRREEKGGKGKGKKASKKPKGRPGFEGSFRARPR